jgi:hypothetical protein
MGPGPFCGRVMAGYAHWSRVKGGGSGFDDGLVLEGEGGACIYVNVDSLRGNISYPHLRASRSTVRN